MDFPAVMQLKNRTLWEDYWRDRSSRDAFARLVDAFLPLVRSVMHRIQIRIPRHVEADDLIQSGLVGLFESIERFDPQQSPNFDAFACFRIKGAILDELRREDFLSRDVRQKYGEISRVIEELTAELGRSPDDHEISARAGVREEEIGRILEMASPALSLDEAVVTIEQGKTVPLKDMLRDESIRPDVEAEKRDMIVMLCRAFRGLVDREQKILYLYYHEFLRIKEIAELFEISEARVCQIHAAALEKLRITVMREQKQGRDD